MSKSASLKRSLADARAYVGKVGRAQHHMLDGELGKVHSLSVKTEIHHQSSPGATNYWQDKDFDLALSKVIKHRFSELAASALALMQLEYKDARISEKESLLAQLAEIEALESE